jgi:D-arabinose 1-dehydrogenase-like Zn-dependent alcohol dehydrogenase
MFHAKAYSAASATAQLAPTRIQRRDPTPHDVQIEILFCGVHGITSDVEVIPIQKVNEAYERLLRQDVKYRSSIDMASLKAG